MPEQTRARVFDDPGRLAQLVGASVITHGVQVDVLEVKRGEDAGAGLAVWLHGRPNHVAEGNYEKLHILGLDVAAKLAAAILIVGTNTWGEQFSGPLDGMLRDPKTIPGLTTESGLLLPKSSVVEAVTKLRRGKR